LEFSAFSLFIIVDIHVLTYFSTLMHKLDKESEYTASLGEV